MNFKRRLATLALAGGLSVTGMAATASPAAAAMSSCPTSSLCLWDSTGYAGDVDWAARSTKQCFDLLYDYGGWTGGIRSYWNRLPVKAAIYHRDGYGTLHYDGTIAPGGHSSDSHDFDKPFGNAGIVCTGGASPWTTP
ncbi:peptidase inhibitor family I36 protein [Streptomyces sp. NPDC101132]|uniref:peptidase inhibitor family I36 protein n=1 Tax=Streptomyces sp. NPDC101132 TaxID=3366110 RepID=UPI003819C5EF